MKNEITTINKELSELFDDRETIKTLLQTTFEGFDEPLFRQAVMKARMMEFDLRDIMIGNVYAIKYRDYNKGTDTVQIITSIGHIRKIGARSGIVGKSMPHYERNGDSIVSCSITVQKATGNHIGDFSAKVFFNEYSTGKNLWKSKPHTMIAKVAEAHAIRMACPEEAKNMYIEEEFEQVQFEKVPEVDEAEIEHALITLDEFEDRNAAREYARSLKPAVRNHKNITAKLAELKEKFELQDKLEKDTPNNTPEHEAN